LSTTCPSSLFADLAEKSWSIQDGFFTPTLIQQLAEECQRQQDQGLLREAGVGRAEQFTVKKTQRSDQILWLENGMSASTDLYLAEMDKLRRRLNEHCFLGLQESENHFAVYPHGAFYRKHLDRFRDDDSRIISSVLYLNSDWKAGHGGELRLHLADQVLDIEPVANRLVLFISAEIWHEVLPTEVERLSLTGWLKQRK
jgi:SM-20-related protein